MPTIELKCEHCGRTVKKRTDKLGKHVYCSRKCFSDSRTVKCTCAVCGREFERKQCTIREVTCCSRYCAERYLSERMTAMNEELNPTRMRLETRIKIRKKHLNTGEGKAYTKFLGKHEHRVVAEKMLGRKLKPREVVHHIDEDKRNNDPSNLTVFSSQAEHMKLHALIGQIPNTKK